LSVSVGSSASFVETSSVFASSETPTFCAGVVPGVSSVVVPPSRA
jgi:hypothetical protein